MPGTEPGITGGVGGGGARGAVFHKGASTTHGQPLGPVGLLEKSVHSRQVHTEGPLNRLGKKGPRFLGGFQGLHLYSEGVAPDDL